MEWKVLDVLAYISYTRAQATYSPLYVCNAKLQADFQTLHLTTCGVHNLA